MAVYAVGAVARRSRCSYLEFGQSRQSFCFCQTGRWVQAVHQFQQPSHVFGGTFAMTMVGNKPQNESRGVTFRFSRICLRFLRNHYGWAGILTCLGATILGCAPESAYAQAAATGSAAETCLAANSNLSLGTRLPRTSARLKAREPLNIVAIGSSSTVGLWELRPSATYPEVMRREILRLQSDAKLSITNSGRVGDTIPDNLARFDRDVLSFKPDLVLWQLGTNDIAWGGHVDDQLKNRIVQGIHALKASGADVILMDLQYAPMVLASAHYSRMQAMITEVAQQERLGLFSRFTLMRKSIDAGLSPGALVSWDRLHNSTEGYDCVGRALARAIVASAR
jgi:acyl-CoA thioesterase-1